MKLYEPKSQIGTVVEFCQSNPGFALSISYVLLTLCGIFYSYGFYSEFSIPFLKLAETSDLLIVGIGEPAALLMFAGALLIALSFDYMTVWSYNKQKQWADQPETLKMKIYKVAFYTPKHAESVIVWITLIFITYTFVFVGWYANWQADRVKGGSGDIVNVSDSETEQENEFMLLGSTANYVFLYSRENNKASILPVENIYMMYPSVPESDAQTQKSPD